MSSLQELSEQSPQTSSKFSVYKTKLLSKSRKLTLKSRRAKYCPSSIYLGRMQVTRSTFHSSKH